jgi:putative exosortase-associated protein (TIGR04073 family)
MAKRLGMMVLALWAGAAAAGEWGDYAGAVGDKFMRGATNIGYGWLEIPKNLANEVNHQGALYAPVGLGKGLLYMAGRWATGTADLVTFVVPTASLVEPAWVWQDSEKESAFFGSADK